MFHTFLELVLLLVHDVVVLHQVFPFLLELLVHKVDAVVHITFLGFVLVEHHYSAIIERLVDRVVCLLHFSIFANILTDTVLFAYFFGESLLVGLNLFIRELV